MVINFKPWVYCRNLGDGSVWVYSFNSEEEAQEYAAPDDERSNDDIMQLDLQIDVDTGKILNVRKRD